MRVAAEIAKSVFWSSKRPLRINNPLLTKRLTDELREDLGPSEWFQRTVKPKFAPGKRFLQGFGELTSEHFCQHVHRKEELLLGRDPTRAIRRQSAGGNNTVDMRMMFELLIPTMQHTEVCSQMLRIASDLEQCLGADPKE